jgi:GNAT superfamily N-acetyltransferase
MTTSLRPATVADAAGIGPCHLACWQETYAGLLSPVFFAEVDGEVVGFAQVVAGRDTPPVRDEELGTLYLRAAHHSSGLGQALLDAVLGDRPASLWVAEDNPRARRFYERNGFVADGERAVLESWEGIAEIRMVR